MTDRPGQDQDTSKIVLGLSKLRGFNGMKEERLEKAKPKEDRKAHPGISALFQLRAVRYLVLYHQRTAGAALNMLVKHCIDDGTEQVHSTYQIVADAIFGLGLYSDRYIGAGINTETAQRLESGKVMTRRELLRNNWSGLHGALGADPSLTLTPIETPGTASEPAAKQWAPSDSTLRKSIEPVVLKELASRLLGADGRGIIGNEPSACDDQLSPDGPSTGNRKGRVLVVGGAVMDAIFQVTDLPTHETSTEASDLILAPGGKGFMQAVASARLDLDVTLLAAVGDDLFGREITDQLKAAKVDTSLLSTSDNSRSGVTGVIEKKLGDSTAVNWRGDAKLILDDINDAKPGLSAYDIVLITFEIPLDVLKSILAAVHEIEQQRPLVILTPGQPYRDERTVYSLLNDIDYLVTRRWELNRLFPHDDQAAKHDRYIKRLLDQGIKNLCLLDTEGCTIYRKGEGSPIRVTVDDQLYPNSAISRDVFCAGLAARLADDSGTSTSEAAKWATAAMACAAEDFPAFAHRGEAIPAAESLPDRNRVEGMLGAANLDSLPSLSDSLAHAQPPKSAS